VGGAALEVLLDALAQTRQGRGDVQRPDAGDHARQTQCSADLRLLALRLADRLSNTRRNGDSRLPAEPGLPPSVGLLLTPGITAQ
jgi:hypothetical protein